MFLFFTVGIGHHVILMSILNMHKVKMLVCFSVQAFDNLLHMNVVYPVEGGESGTGKTMKEFKLMKLNILEDQVKEAVKTYRECPRDVAEWAMQRGCKN